MAMVDCSHGSNDDDSLAEALSANGEVEELEE
jgi:hypothetical protein